MTKRQNLIIRDADGQDVGNVQWSNYAIQFQRVVGKRVSHENRIKASA